MTVAEARARCTPMQLEFIAAYVHGPHGVRYNLTASARTVGYSPRTARQMGSELNHKPHVRAVIDAELADEMAERRRAWELDFQARTRRRGAPSFA